MGFSATDAAFEGFRVVRREPLTVVWWSLFYFAILAVALLLGGGSIAAMMAAAEALEQSGNPSPEDLQPLLAIYGSLFAWALPLGLLVSAILYAAVARSVLRPAEKAFGYLRLGMDEVRVLVVSVVLGLIFFVLWLVLAGVVGGLAGVTVASEQPALWLVVVLAVLGGLALLIWLAVRLSLAIPMTLDQGRFAIFDSFAATKGRFWALLGMAIIAAIMSILVSLLGSIVGLPLTMATGGLEKLAAFEGAGIAEIIQAAWPIILGWSVVNAIVTALQTIVMYAPFSAAWRDIKAARAA